jgi:hypothetical protein
MIKRNTIPLFMILVSLGCFFSCSQEYDPVFKETPDDRVRAALAAYTNTLTTAPFGWKATLRTGTGSTFLYYFDFNTDGSVAMAADFNETTAGDVTSGTWVLKALQRPTLSFDTYSYIHLPADPDGDVNGGQNGQGLLSDFEFAFSRTSGDTVFLEGIQRGSAITFVKATEEDAAVFLTGELQNMLHYFAVQKGLRLLLPDDKTVTMAFHPTARVMGLQYLSDDGQGVASFTSSFTFTTRGVALSSPVPIDGHTVREFLWDAEKETYTVELGNTTEDVVNVDGLYLFEPATPLYSVIGSAYTFIQVPQGSGVYPLPGQSELFTSRYIETAEALRTGELALTLNEINFVFDEVAQTLQVNAFITQNGTRYLAQYTYSYTLTSDGVFKFAFDTANNNGWLIFEDMYYILNYLETDRFTMAYVGGGYNLIGALFSVDKSDFYFSGYLGE